MKRIQTIFLLLAFALMAFGQEKEMTVAERNAAQGFNDTIDRLDPDFVLVSLCVADPTDWRDDALGVTGHAFLRLQCPVFNLDYCFSYESENIEGQFADFLAGKLKMGMFAILTDEYVEDYRRWRRAVHEYRLNLPPDAELRLWEQMDNHMMTEQELQMDLIKFGCTNTILLYVEKALLPTVIQYKWPEKFLQQSAMDLAKTQLKRYPASFAMFKMAYGKELERLRTPKQKVIFPNDLLEVWSNATIEGKPVLEYVGDLVEAPSRR